MTAPFRGSGPWRGRGPFLGRGPWAGKAPFGFNAGLPFAINVTAAQLRDALANPSAWGETLGPELVVNGGFDSDTVWSKADGGGSATITGSVLVLSGGDAAFPNVTQSGVLISGRTYQVEVVTTTAVVVTELGVRIGGSTNNGPVPVAAGTYAARVVSNGADVRLIRNAGYGGSTATIASISVREVVTGWLLPGLGGARLSGDCRTSVAMQTEADGTVGYAAHNLLPYSESIVGGTGPWIANSATVTANNVIGPTGTLTASRVVADGTGINQGIYATQSAAPIGTVATFTVWLRGAVGGEVVLIGDASARQSVTLTTSWQRYENPGHALLITPQVVYALNNTAMTYYAWGAQLNLGPTALPYVPTTTAAVYAPAVDWLAAQSIYGLRSEAAATNLVLWSADMSNAAWLSGGVGITVSANSIVGPDGVLSADRVTTGVSGYASFRQQISVAQNTQYTLSFFYEATQSSAGGRFRVYNTTGSADIVADTAYVEGTGWTRTTHTFTTPAGCTEIGIYPVSVSVGATPSVFYLWGAQLETGSRASSPILTLGSSATRAADNLTIPLTATMPTGGVIVDYVPVAAGSGTVLSINDGTANERHLLTNDGVYAVTDGGAAQASISTATPTVGALNTMRARWAANAMRAQMNATLGTEDTSGTMPTVTQIQIGDGVTRLRLTAQGTKVVA